MIHTTENFFNKCADGIRQRFFPDVKHYRDNDNCTKATYTIELFNNGCITYRTFISRLSKSCGTNNATIHILVEKYIVSFGQYHYKPRSKWSTSKVETNLATL